MIISTSHKFSFLCTPKCASTSIERSISKKHEMSFTNKSKHINVKQYDKHIRPMLKSMFPKKNIETFCLMREPIEWLSSWYRYLKRKELTNPAHPNHRSCTANISFHEFIGYVLGEIPNDTNRFLPTKQSLFILSESNQIGVDHLFQMERLDLVQEFLQSKTGADINIEKVNVSPKIKLDLDFETREKLNEYFRHDYEIFENLQKTGHSKF